MKNAQIPKYRIVKADMTGFGWVAVQKWNGSEYKHLSTFRAVREAEKFIRHETA